MEAKSIRRMRGNWIAQARGDDNPNYEFWDGLK